MCFVVIAFCDSISIIWFEIRRRSVSQRVQDLWTKELAGRVYDSLEKLKVQKVVVMK